MQSVQVQWKKWRSCHCISQSGDNMVLMCHTLDILPLRHNGTNENRLVWVLIANSKV